jgi:hypothetical protein
MRKATVCLLFLLLSSLGFAAGPLVVTGQQITHSLARALTRGTNVRVRYPFPEYTRMEDQALWFKEHPAESRELAGQTDAVITIKGAWPADPLFPALRAHNIRMVEIDCCAPVEAGRTPVALIAEPGQKERNHHSPFVWQHLANASRMAEILAQDLARLYPQHQQPIARNLTTLKRRIFRLRTLYQNQFAQLDCAEVAALCPNFVYLTADAQVDVLSYHLKPENAWTEADARAFEKELRENEIKVVLHQWEPTPLIQRAIDRAGARVVVLKTMNPPTIGPATDYLQQITANLETLHQELKNEK